MGGDAALAPSPRLRRETWAPASVVKIAEQLLDGAVLRGVPPGRRDFGEGLEDEAALVQCGMWECEGGVLHHDGAVEEQIEVDDARSFGWGGGAVAAHGVLDGEQAVEEIEGKDVGFQQGGGVDEARLVGVADGIGLVELGDGFEAAEVVEPANGFAQVVGGATESGLQVGAESDGGEHGAWESVAGCDALM